MSNSLIDSMIESRNEAWQQAKGILDKAERENRELTKDEAARFDRINADLDAKDERLKELAQIEARTKDSEEQRSRIFGSRIHGLDCPQSRMAGSVYRAASNVIMPTFTEYRALAEGTSTAGGFLVPPDHRSEWFDILRAASVFLSAGPRIISTARDEVHIPKTTTATTGNMVAENAPIPESDPAFGEVVLNPKKAAFLTGVSNELLEDSEPSVRQILAADHLQGLATLLDKQFLEGNGAGTNMVGLRNFSGVTTTSLGANGAAPTLDDIADAITRLELDNASAGAIFMSPRTWATYRKLKDADTRYMLSPNPTTESARRLFDLPVYTTGNISTNETQGTSTTSSWIAVVDLSQIVVAEREDLRVDYSPDYKFNQDQTYVRTIARYDIDVMNDKAVELITGVNA